MNITESCNTSTENETRVFFNMVGHQLDDMIFGYRPINAMIDRIFVYIPFDDITGSQVVMETLRTFKFDLLFIWNYQVHLERPVL